MRVLGGRGLSERAEGRAYCSSATDLGLERPCLMRHVYASMRRHMERM